MYEELAQYAFLGTLNIDIEMLTLYSVVQAINKVIKQNNNKYINISKCYLNLNAGMEYFYMTLYTTTKMFQIA
jgi:hypothetical protein